MWDPSIGRTVFTETSTVATATPVQPLGAKTALALVYTAADPVGNRLKTYDGSADYLENGGLLLIIRNTSGVTVTATLFMTTVVVPNVSVPAGATMVFGPFGGLAGPIDIQWSASSGVSVAAIDAVTLGRNIVIRLPVPSANTGTDVVTVTWGYAIDGVAWPLPVWATFDLLWRQIQDVTKPGGDGATQNVNAGVTSPYSHQKLGTGGHGWDVLSSGGTVGRLFYRIRMKDASGTVVGSSDEISIDVNHA